ncbi:orotidine-5'-phosphate decarboxylase [Taylorella equigenitalis]|nr:orotidine-5'-phosphate decarboxylase [Taylorella equigenitalis]ASY37425.1 orotidine-5'-phosphate decarboxylase [Taylorella equigenitalis]RBA25915.1 orotidine-5'-phosphate decarboxylase [Taylorella equigenitalis]WDU48197.1 orotidine-5'-phosphate decarboxylase [Taylorella equigenitalis]WDU56676.1 orotidine-5'-phosphate decarboxylase [Taylorella equigenitalis]WEE00753.1 orotidine-5'-phosphate decarboxylase [Taylorella equigenitalis]
MKFTEKLSNSWTQQQSALMLGLDPDIYRLPANYRSTTEGVYKFCCDMVDACAPYVCGFKPQIAYFASLGAERELERIFEYIRSTYPTHISILDAKRGDIGSTAKQYAIEAFERYGADAVTVNPYMGFDSIEPYLKWSDRGVIVLCRTSNSGGSDVQFLDVSVDGRTLPLYQHIAKLAATKWNSSGQIGLVVGATFPEEIKHVREIIGTHMPLLIPGIGAQGGDIEATVAAGINSEGHGVIINSSRAILYASDGDDCLKASADMARNTRDKIQEAIAKNVSKA